jgi:hypothetical protein
MKTIYKYPLEVADLCDVQMPEGAVVLTVQALRNQPCLWAEVDTKAKTIKRRFRTYGTGHPRDDAQKFPHYVGTYQISDGLFVFHVFTDRIER